MSNDLVAFLRNCLDEEQREAEAALKRTTTTRRMIRGQWVEDTVQPPEWRRSAWSPSRVLAEVEARRAIVDLCTPPLVEVTGIEDTEPRFIEGAGPAWGEPVLRHLALPYADHLDYRDEWRP